MNQKEPYFGIDFGREPGSALFTERGPASTFSNAGGQSWVSDHWHEEPPAPAVESFPMCAVCRKPVKLVHRVDDPYAKDLIIVIVCHGNRQIVHHYEEGIQDGIFELGVKEAFRATVVLRKRPKLKATWRKVRR